MAEVMEGSTNGTGLKKKKKGVGRVLAKKQPRKAGRPDLLGRFGPYLSKRRMEKNLTIRQFAKRVGWAHTNVFQFEYLRKNPRLTELEELAKVYREPLAKFLEPVL